MKKQIWIVSINDADGGEVARREFADGTSTENYEMARDEYSRVLNGYRWFGFKAAPSIWMREA